MRDPIGRRSWLTGVILGCSLVVAGCHTTQNTQPSPLPHLPRELAKVSQPQYVIETPDVLLIDALRVVPKPPFLIEPLDSLFIRASNVIDEEPIGSVFTVEPEGRVNLGASYGAVDVADLTLRQAEDAITAELRKTFKKVRVTVALVQGRGKQQIRGEHLVRPDGTVSLGVYGSVYVTGMTLARAKAAIELHLSQYLKDPEVSVDVINYNSKVYYIITDGGGAGEQVYRLACTGNETVLDALAQINGLPPVASNKEIWLARPAPAEADCTQVLPVDWKAITRGGATRTNYQVFPGDRIFVNSDPLVRTDTFLARLFSPIERTLGLTLLGSTTVQSFNGNGAVGGGGGFR